MPRGGSRPGAGRKKRSDSPSESAAPRLKSLNAENADKRIGEGKPGPGRPPGTPNKVTAALKDYADQYTEEAVVGLVKIARHKKTPAAAKVAAWREILDRGHGRAPQSHGLTGSKGEALGPRRVIIELDDVTGAPA